MTTVRPVEEAHQKAHHPAKVEKKRSLFNIYPLLGVVLVLVTALLTYGGLLLFFVDDWSFLQFGEPAKASR
ncbi:hypothetical protein [Massilia consociata]|uniref:Uncharacterized protein n=1 Tax=Massilia consociata TaxID=760117 RepID=A0ABV6FIZ1_9BURK